MVGTPHDLKEIAKEAREKEKTLHANSTNTIDNTGMINFQSCSN